nr:DnaJ C-terminal domain-containing protein [uncultured Moraxella sp.]
MAEKNYYDILGVDKKASEDEIKKAYRKLVRKHHPDISKDPDADKKMGEINNAYETLKDSQKRSQYDAMLNNPFMGQGGFGGFNGGGFGGGGFNNASNVSQEDLEEILRHFGGGSFGGGGAGFGQGQSFGFEDLFQGFGGRSQQQAQKGEDEHTEIVIDLQASYDGDTRKITISSPVQTMSGVSYDNKTIQVKIPKGISEGQKIRLAKQGQANAYGDNGDLYLTVKFKNDDKYKIDGKNVTQIVDVSPWEAVFGGTITVTTPVGKVNVNIPKSSKNGTKLRLKGKGIPAKDAGDLFLQLNIVLPSLSTDESRQKEQQQAWRFLQEMYHDFSPAR